MRIAFITVFLFLSVIVSANNSEVIQNELKNSKNSETSIFPNPIQTKAIIKFVLLHESEVVIEFFDLTGKKVKLNSNQFQTNGSHQVEIDTSELKSGVYLCKITTSEWIEAKRVIIKH